MYLSLWAGTSYYRFISNDIGFVAMIAVTALALALRPRLRGMAALLLVIAAFKPDIYYIMLVVGITNIPAVASHIKGKILFFEDLDEVPYRFDRMLTQWLNAGLLQQQLGELQRAVLAEPRRDRRPGEHRGRRCGHRPAGSGETLNERIATLARRHARPA